MNVNLLREYVELLLTEKYRLKKDKPRDIKFSLEKLSSIDNLSVADAYANMFLEFLGAGSSRIVYALSPNQVLKIARNEAGIDQNAAEMDVYTNPQSKPLAAKVHDYDTDFKWIIADAVRPLRSGKEWYIRKGVGSKEEALKNFQDYSGMEWQDFNKQLNLYFRNKKSEVKLSPFSKMVIDFMNQNNLLVGDITNLEHWGMTPDRRVVLLDYGFTEGVYDTHYAHRLNAVEKEMLQRIVQNAETADGALEPVTRKIGQ